jgi:methionyl-tRNA formyltransferase
MNAMKAIILCNNPVAIPGIKEFLFYGHVAAVATTRRNKEMQHILQQLLHGSDIPIEILYKRDYRSQLTELIKEHDATVVIMMTFPYIIPKDVLELPPKGFINFHYGLLPQCGGPHPILWHLLNNDAEAGVTVHQVDEGVDTGPVIMQEKASIATDDTYGTLQSKLAYLAAKLASNLLKVLSYGTMIPVTAQDTRKSKYFEMPTAADLTIKWQDMTAQHVNRLVNACNPWNKGAGTMINNWFIGITEVAFTTIEDETDATAGTIMACNDAEGLLVKTSDGQLLKINIIYTAEGFFSGSRLAGYGVQPGMRFG